MKYDLVRIQAPGALPVSVQDMHGQLRLDPEGSPQETPEDDLIEGYLQAAVAHLDGKAGVLNRAIVSQQWRLSTCGFPGGRKITLPLPPLISVQSVKYLDDDGDLQTFASSNYRVVTDAEPGYVLLNDGATWPVPNTDPDSVRVEFTCGYGDADDVPATVKHAIKLLVTHWFENREAVAFVQTHKLPHAVDDLLSAVRFHGVV